MLNWNALIDNRHGSILHRIQHFFNMWKGNITHINVNHYDINMRIFGHHCSKCDYISPNHYMINKNTDKIDNNNNVWIYGNENMFNFVKFWNNLSK